MTQRPGGGRHAATVQEEAIGVLDRFEEEATAFAKRIESSLDTGYTFQEAKQDYASVLHQLQLLEDVLTTSLLVNLDVAEEGTTDVGVGFSLERLDKERNEQTRVLGAAESALRVLERREKELCAER